MGAVENTGQGRPIDFGTQFFHRILWPLPIVWLGLFGLLLLRARWVSGSWPFPTYLDRSSGAEFPAVVYSPLDPKEFPVHLFVILILLAPAMLSVVGVVLAHVVLVMRGRRPGRARLVLSIAGSAALWLLIAFDPGGMFVWLAD